MKRWADTTLVDMLLWLASAMLTIWKCVGEVSDGLTGEEWHGQKYSLEISHFLPHFLCEIESLAPAYFERLGSIFLECSDIALIERDFL